MFQLTRIRMNSVTWECNVIENIIRIAYQRSIYYTQKKYSICSTRIDRRYEIKNESIRSAVSK